jgi:hypothetical protein
MLQAERFNAAFLRRRKGSISCVDSLEDFPSEVSGAEITLHQ